MKTLRLIIALLLVGLALGANAQVTRRTGGNNNTRKKDKKEAGAPAISERQQAFYEVKEPHDADLQWMKVIYRSLDLTKGKNQALFYPELPNEDGANLYFISIVGSLLLGVIYYLYYLSDVKAKTPYLLIVRYEAAAEERLADALAGISRRNLRSKSVNENGMCEVTYEIERLTHTDSILLSLQQVRGVQSVNLVSYQNDFGM